jgi:excisionase family DNA binding protein
MEDRWLSVEEIAEYLGVTRDTVYAWLSRKGLPGHRIGRLWKFKREEVDEWVRAGSGSTRSPKDRRGHEE